MSESPQLLTIGHSNHIPQHFLSLVSKYAIDVVVDVRSWPRSRHVEWADREQLPALLGEVEAQYLFLGAELGGRPKTDAFYDDSGHVLYGRLSRAPSYRHGLARLRQGLATHRVAVMCSEEDPTFCHRRLLIAKTLLEQGVKVTHIRGRGDLQPELGSQLYGGARLFDEDEDLWWKSSASVSPIRRPKISSVG
jgi:uncharacterized protein (DUF488 family)